jgi:HEAT repeat protein
MEDDEEMAGIPDESFKQEVEAEIAVLLTMFGESVDARERLSVILRRSPERFAQLIGQAPDEKTLEHLGLLLRRLGRPAMEVALACYFSSDAQLQGQAATLLRRFVAAGKPGPEGMPLGRMARLESYLLLDQLLQASVATAAKARLLDELLEACSEERTSLLLASALLYFREDAFPLLLRRFWGASSSAELYRSNALYALCRTGTRFAAALLEPLQKGDARQQALALAGAEAVARSLRCDWLDLDTVPDDRVALEARFRWKWAPPLKQDRDPAVLQALAASVVAFLDDDRADLREMALHTLGLLRAEAQRDAIQACVRHPHPGTRRAALRALVEIGDAGAAPLLLEVARGGVPAEQREAVRGLGRLGVVEAVPLLTALLDHPDPEVGRAAVFAVGEIGGAPARAKLQALLAQPGPLREAAARALHAGAPGDRPSPKDRAARRATGHPGRRAAALLHRARRRGPGAARRAAV